MILVLITTKIPDNSWKVWADQREETHKHLPTIRLVVVALQFQRRGLAANLLKRAINELAPASDWVNLAVTEGNPAVVVNQNLGFIPVIFYSNWRIQHN